MRRFTDKKITELSDIEARYTRGADLDADAEWYHYPDAKGEPEIKRGAFDWLMLFGLGLSVAFWVILVVAFVFLLKP